MITYVSAFIFYTLAMIGVLLIGFVVYKKTFLFNKQYSKGAIEILDTLPIAPKKNLMVVKVNNEKFLIASGESHTTFLSKLEIPANNLVENNLKTMPEIEKNISQISFIKDDKKPEIKTTNEKIEEIRKKFKELYYQDNNSDLEGLENLLKKKTNPIDKLRNGKKLALRRLMRDLSNNQSSFEEKVNG